MQMRSTKNNPHQIKEELVGLYAIIRTFMILIKSAHLFEAKQLITCSLWIVKWKNGCYMTESNIDYLLEGYLFPQLVEMTGSTLNECTEIPCLLYDHRPRVFSEDNYLRICQVPKRKVGKEFREH